MNPFCRYISILSFQGMLCLLLSHAGLAQASFGDSLFLSFRATLSDNNIVQLHWEFASADKKQVQFTVERSIDGVVFQPLNNGSFPATQTGIGYQYSDPVFLRDSAFYRISGIDGDGKATYYSEIRKVQRVANSKAEIVIMPNPVFNNASLIINAEGVGEISCILYDMTGKNIRSYLLKKTTVYLQQILDMYSIPKGEYILSIRGNMINESKRILKQ
ncbi:MAG TPA: T9SS type A sorting domain-containing protein [Agriterribacter sp.]|nr:T9SS type A sorting domain-containing protein [Agriterribacter sp.]